MQNRDSGPSAFAICDIAGLTTEDLEEAADRIKAAGYGDPFQGIRVPLKEAGIPIADYFKFLNERQYNPHVNRIDSVIKEMIAYKKYETR
jgi:hypothetical protein